MAGVDADQARLPAASQRTGGLCCLYAKLLAAHRAGFERVILPKENEADLAELPDEVRKALEFVFAERIGDVFAAALPGFVGAGEGRKAVAAEH